ncbi:MAG: hypothetical protein ACKVWR_02575 [Acidimicrobiales bacterium]
MRRLAGSLLLVSALLLTGCGLGRLSGEPADRPAASPPPAAPPPASPPPAAASVADPPAAEDPYGYYVGIGVAPEVARCMAATLAGRGVLSVAQIEQAPDAAGINADIDRCFAEAG